MGVFDSLCIACPRCGEELEFQSKTGACILETYNKNNLPPVVAEGMNGDITICSKCNSEIKLICKIPKKVPCKVVVYGGRQKQTW